MTVLSEGELGKNVPAFLDMLAYSEIGPWLLANSDNGYNVIVGSHGPIVRPGKPTIPPKLILMDTYAYHPKKYQQDMNSDAAGRYQFMGRYWEPYRKQLSLSDFGPASQDLWAKQLLRECKALGMIAAGEFDRAVQACRSRWASLPGAGYGQHEQPLHVLAKAYEAAGGQFSDPEQTQPGAVA